MLTSDMRFKLGSVEIDGTAANFYQWALSNPKYPLIRGVLVEYMLSTYIRSHGNRIAKPAINELTHEKADGQSYKDSLDDDNQSQRHGDFTDLQLHWGLHFELKSTVRDARSYIAKTRFYDPIHYHSSSRKEFVCPFYIFFEMARPPEVIGNTLVFEELAVYVIKGEDLERLEHTARKGVSYKTIFNSDLTVQCRIEDLPQTLEELVVARVKSVQEKLTPGWKIPLGHGNVLWPLALEVDGNVQAGYWNRLNHRLFEDMTKNVWKDGIKPSWRDWEAAGFHYAVQPSKKIKPTKLRKSSVKGVAPTVP
ncbi:hypothetical protein [Pseudomonas sp. GM48]|uniref:hypothetical protein n=1 Tax=Pseudomonas sp. GM48 TaxID=1144330 RepID=UPI00026FDDC4|nr:hypothetical protein [Pseudomonas sp. GM48]EJM56185.1 hypothetical protein PMI28_03166 [Pseudomonas sp. GM48]